MEEIIPEAFRKDKKKDGEASFSALKSIEIT